jgi:hypothetical protein
MIDEVNVKGGNDKIDHRSARDLGLADKTYPCKEIDVIRGDDQRGVMVATIDNQSYLFFLHMTSTNSWMFRISEMGNVEKAVYAIAHGRGFNDVTNEKQTSSEFITEKQFWSDWLTTNTNAPSNKP